MILDKLTSITPVPFPHAVIREALPWDLYHALVSTWPTKQPSGENQVRLSRGHKLIARGDLTADWLEFIGRHQSREFFEQVNDLFGLGLSGTVSARGSNGKIGVECQLADTSPVTRPSSVKGPHWDSPKTKWAGILYCRDPSDTAGGDLQLYDVPRPRLYKDRFTSNHGEPFLTIPYEANTFVCWVNSPISIHGVSERQPTNIPRRYINFTVDA